MLKEICNIKENIDLKEYNTYKLNSIANYMAFPKNKEEIINLIKYLKENNIKYFLLGNGSNVIIPDETFNGVVINLKDFNNFEIDKEKVYADAGCMLPKLGYKTISLSLKGLEWACGIPGTLGGSIRGNAGAYLHEIMEYVESIDVLDEDLNVITLKKEDIKYSYRHTSLKDNDYIILSAVLKLEQGNKEESLALVEDRLNRRKSSQPLEYPSAGSVFRNPEGLSTGKLIEDLGIKGTQIGDAQISLKHGNFIINLGNAKSSDIKSLIELMKEKVKKEYNIDLICEQEIIK